MIIWLILDVVDIFAPPDNPKTAAARHDIARSQNKELKELFKFGFGIHHAGMLRSDRNLVERLFTDGIIKVSSMLIGLTNVNKLLNNASH
jgi:hypothetical protein